MLALLAAGLRGANSAVTALGNPRIELTSKHRASVGIQLHTKVLQMSV